MKASIPAKCIVFWLILFSTLWVLPLMGSPQVDQDKKGIHYLSAAQKISTPATTKDGYDANDAKARVAEVTTGTVSGRVTDSGGNGIDNICVIVHDFSGNQINNSWTDANGDYAVNGVPTGTYRVRFSSASNPGFVSEWFNDKKSFETADPVGVLAGGTTSGINAVLAAAGFMAGRVTDGEGSGIAGIYVFANDIASDYVSYSWTDANGDYTVAELPSGSYKVKFDTCNAPGFMVEWYNDKTGFENADLVNVTAGSTTPGIDAVLTQAGIISGRVTDSGANGIQDIAAYIFDLDQNCIASAYTDANGNYVASGFPTGTYKVQFVSGYDPAFASEWNNNKPDFLIADPVSVTAGSTTSGIDAVLTGDGPIGVMLTAPNGGENWTVGDYKDITWNAYGVSDTLKLTLFKDGSQVGVIASGVDASAGSHAWTVGQYIGGMAEAATGYTVRIKEQGTTVADESDAAFTITAVSGDTFVYDGIWEDGATAGVEGWHPGDYDGDGIIDLLNILINYNKVFVSDGTQFIKLGRWLKSVSGLYGWFPGDFNGDGKTDLMRFTPANDWGPDRTQVFLSTGTAFVKDYIWVYADPGSEGYTVGDFNGDGKDDMLIYDTASLESRVYVSSGSEFLLPSVWFTGHNGMDGWYTGDFNGDGRTDLARTHSENGTVVLLSTGTAFTSAGVWTPALPQAGGWLVADYNGDGMDDLLRGKDDVAGTEVFLSTGAAFQYDGVWSDAPAVSAAWRVGDFSGDTRADLLFYQVSPDRQTEVYLSTPAGSSSGALKATRDANHLNDGIDLSRPVLPQSVEDELIQPWLNKWRCGEEGNFFYRIKREYEEKLGRKVRDNVIYRMLSRHRKENSEKVKVKYPEGTRVKRLK